MLRNRQESKHQWYLKNRSRLLEMAKKYRETHKKEVADYKRKWRMQHPNYNKDYFKIYFAKNQGKLKDRNRENYRRIRSDPLRWERYSALARARALTVLRTKGGKVVSNVKKRPCPNNVCEICGRQRRKLAYHHWNDSDLTKGIWVCCGCHMMAEGIDKGLHELYLFRKKAIDTERALTEDSIKEFDQAWLEFKATCKI